MSTASRGHPQVPRRRLAARRGCRSRGQAAHDEPDEGDRETTPVTSGHHAIALEGPVSAHPSRYLVGVRRVGARPLATDAATAIPKRAAATTCSTVCTSVGRARGCTRTQEAAAEGGRQHRRCRDRHRRTSRTTSMSASTSRARLCTVGGRHHRAASRPAASARRRGGRRPGTGTRGRRRRP